MGYCPEAKIGHLRWPRRLIIIIVMIIVVVVVIIFIIIFITQSKLWSFKWYENCLETETRTFGIVTSPGYY